MVYNLRFYVTRRGIAGEKTLCTGGFGRRNTMTPYLSELKGKNILVTGGAGFIGSHLGWRGEIQSG